MGLMRESEKKHEFSQNSYYWNKPEPQFEFSRKLYIMIAHRTILSMCIVLVKFDIIFFDLEKVLFLKSNFEF